MTSKEGEGTLDLHELKRQRGNRKETITRTMKALESFKDLSLNELDSKKVIKIEKVNSNDEEEITKEHCEGPGTIQGSFAG